MSSIQHFYTKPVFLMVLAVFVWMFYPPLINSLIEKNNIFHVATLVHTFAAFFSICFLIIFFRKKNKIFISIFANKSTWKKILFPTCISGILIFCNHLLLYAALSISTTFDIIVILIFETWPILFFFVDSHFRKDKRGSTTARHLVFFASTFVGFLILIIPNIDIHDFSLLNTDLLLASGLALTGGIAMALNNLFRLKCMDAWKESTVNIQSINTFNLGLLTEASVRFTASILFLSVFFISDQTSMNMDSESIFLSAFIGIIILSFGSLLYDMAAYKAENASITGLWYLMPIGSILVLSFMDSKAITQYEAIALALIVASNIFLSLKIYVKSILLTLFISIITIGFLILWAPVFPVSDYYNLLAVSTVFFVLLASFSLERVSSQNTLHENIFIDFREQVFNIFEEHKSTLETNDNALQYIRLYCTEILSAFSKGYSNLNELHLIQSRSESLKNKILNHHSFQKNQLLNTIKLFKVGDNLISIENDRISPSEFVILLLLCISTIYFSISFRDNSFPSDIFAFTVSISSIYLLLVIYDRDNYREISNNHIVACENTLKYLNSKKSTVLPNTLIKSTCKTNFNNAKRSNNTTYLIFGIYSFIISAFTYAFSYADQQPTDINNPPIIVEKSTNHSPSN